MRELSADDPGKPARALRQRQTRRRLRRASGGGRPEPRRGAPAARTATVPAASDEELLRARRAISALAKVAAAPPRAAAARWYAARAGQIPAELPASATPWITSAVETALKRDLRELLSLEPLPEEIRPRPAHPREGLWAFRPIRQLLDAWRADAEIRRGHACHVADERARMSPLCALDPMAQLAGMPVQPEITEHLDQLVAAAYARLRPIAAQVPVERRSPAITATWPFLIAAPDVLLGDLLIAIKHNELPQFSQHWIRQIVRCWLQDVDDELGIRRFAIYDARTGQLVEFPREEILGSAAAPARSKARPSMELLLRDLQLSS